MRLRRIFLVLTIILVLAFSLFQLASATADTAPITWNKILQIRSSGSVSNPNAPNVLESGDISQMYSLASNGAKFKIAAQLNHYPNNPQYNFPFELAANPGLAQFDCSSYNLIPINTAGTYNTWIQCAPIHYTISGGSNTYPSLEQVSLTPNDTYVHTFNNRVYTVRVIGFGSNGDHAIISVNGVSISIAETETKTVDGLRVFASAISSWNNGIDGMATLILGPADSGIETVSLTPTDTYVHTFNNIEYTIRVIGFSATSASVVVSVNGATDNVAEGNSKTINGLNIYARTVASWNNGIDGYATLDISVPDSTPQSQFDAADLQLSIPAANAYGGQGVIADAKLYKNGVYIESDSLFVSYAEVYSSTTNPVPVPTTTCIPGQMSAVGNVNDLIPAKNGCIYAPVAGSYGKLTPEGYLYFYWPPTTGLTGDWPSAYYPVQISTPGEYSVQMTVKATSASDDSFLMMMYDKNGNQMPYVGYVGSPQIPNQQMVADVRFDYATVVSGLSPYGNFATIWGDHDQVYPLASDQFRPQQSIQMVKWNIQDPGTYTLRIVRRENGALLKDVKIVPSLSQVINTTNKAPVIVSAGGPTNIKVNEAGTWSINAYDPEGKSLYYNIHWGDEAFDRSASAPAQITAVSQSTFQHTYYTPGVYTIEITVSDEQGLATKSTLQVVVNQDVQDYNTSSVMLVNLGEQFTMGIGDTAQIIQNGIKINLQNAQKGVCNPTPTGTGAIKFSVYDSTTQYSDKAVMPPALTNAVVTIYDANNQYVESKNTAAGTAAFNLKPGTYHAFVNALGYMNSENTYFSIVSGDAKYQTVYLTKINTATAAKCSVDTSACYDSNSAANAASTADRITPSALLYGIVDKANVWNSQQFTAQKVCRIIPAADCKENCVEEIYSFDQPGCAIVKQIGTADTTKPTVRLNSPINQSFGINQTVSFSCSGVDNTELKSVEFWLTEPNKGFYIAETRAVSGLETTQIFTKSFPNPGNYAWNCKYVDSSGNYDWGYAQGLSAGFSIGTQTATDTTFLVGLGENSPASDTVLAIDIISQLQKQGYISGNGVPVGLAKLFGDIDGLNINNQVTLAIYYGNAVVIIGKDSPPRHTEMAKAIVKILADKGITARTMLSSDIKYANLIYLFKAQTITPTVPPSADSVTTTVAQASGGSGGGSSGAVSIAAAMAQERTAQAAVSPTAAQTPDANVAVSDTGIDGTIAPNPGCTLDTVTIYVDNPNDPSMRAARQSYTMHSGDSITLNDMLLTFVQLNPEGKAIFMTKNKSLLTIAAYMNQKFDLKTGQAAELKSDNIVMQFDAIEKYTTGTEPLASTNSNTQPVMAYKVSGTVQDSNGKKTSFSLSRGDVLSINGVSLVVYDIIPQSDYAVFAFVNNAAVIPSTASADAANQILSLRDCSGCIIDSTCVSTGIRAKNSDGKAVFCDLDKSLKAQKSDGSECQNDFECDSNTCSSGKCINIQKQLDANTSAIQKILAWIGRIFGSKTTSTQVTG